MNENENPVVNTESNAESCADASAAADAAKEGCCCERKKIRTPEEHRALLNRLSRIEGQLRGIRSMIENDAYCMDIMIQVSAAHAALSSFSCILLSDHLRTCVADDLKNGGTQKVEELIAVFQRYMK